MGQQLKKVEEYINEAIKNINDDRSITSTLLSDLIVEMKKSPQPEEAHQQMGQIAAKYVALSSKDKDELFDLIQGAG